MKRVSGALFVILAAIVLSAGCEMIAGFEEHSFQTESDPECDKYCDTVIRACTGTHALYAKRETCLGVCKQFPKGDPLEPSEDNTLACRIRQAEFAESTREPASYCRFAGPGGGGKCGTNCEAYCALLQASCRTQFGALNDCTQACAALKDTNGFDIEANYNGDTVQCRLVHLSTATVDPMAHCSHAQLQPTPPCMEKPTEPPDCEEFCRINQIACAREFAVYESPAQCLAVCKALPLGMNGDREENTSACRHWHTYNSLIDPGQHCGHTAPGGDGHCGLDESGKTGNCVAYCILLEKACADGFSSRYGSQGACQVDCSARGRPFGATADSKYNIASAQSGNTLQCRLLHVSRALSDEAHCPSALGQDACQ